MAEVRKVDCKSVIDDDFTPSEMYLVVLTQEDTQSLVSYAQLVGKETTPALQSVVNGGLSLFKDLSI